MKLRKYIYVAAALAAGFVAAACDDDGYWTAAETAATGSGAAFKAYTFNATSSSYTYGPEDEMTDIDVTVTRSNTSGQVTIPITANFSDSALIIGPNPSCVTFADGENQAIYTIKVLKQFELGQSATAELIIEPENIGFTAVKKPTEPEEIPDSVKAKMTEEELAAAEAAYNLADSLYNDSLIDYNTYIKQLATYKLSTTVNLQKDYPWTSLGMATITDDLFDS